MNIDLSRPPSLDPELSDLEGGLFALMRDEVITELRTDSVGPPFTWQCRCVFGDGNHMLFSSKISALDAYMQAYAVFAERKLLGQPVYSRGVQRRRRKLGLE